MTVIQKSTRAEMVKIIQDRMVELCGGGRPTDRIEQDLILFEAVGLISFAPDDGRDRSLEHEAATIMVNAVPSVHMSGAVPCVMIDALAKAGIRLVRDKTG